MYLSPREKRHALGRIFTARNKEGLQALREEIDDLKNEKDSIS
jgi:hypothetical protein